jgi:hypothetical protein
MVHYTPEEFTRPGRHARFHGVAAPQDWVIAATR